MSDLKIEYEISPVALVAGYPAEADRFLLAHLWGSTKLCIRTEHVLNWANILGARGEAFASHAAVCHYWLYEHYSGYDHKHPFDAVPGDAARDARSRHRARRS